MHSMILVTWVFILPLQSEFQQAAIVVVEQMASADGIDEDLMRLRRLEDQRRELMQIVSPVGPCVETAALVLLHTDSCILQNGNCGMAVLKRDVVLAGIHPEEAKRFARRAVLRHVRVLLFLDRIGTPSGAEQAAHHVDGRMA